MASQFTLVSPGRVLVKAGAIVSMITKSAVVVDPFPQLSDAVNVTDVVDTVGQGPLAGVAVAESSLQLTEPVAVEAEAPPFAAIHNWNSAVLPAPSQFTVSFAAGVPITGGSESVSCQKASAVAVLPQASVAVNVTVVESPAQPSPIV